MTTHLTKASLEHFIVYIDCKSELEKFKRQMEYINESKDVDLCLYTTPSLVLQLVYACAIIISILPQQYMQQRYAFHLFGEQYALLGSQQRMTGLP